MSNNFSLTNYIELLNKQDLSKTEKRKLASYKITVEQQISYNRREEYFSLIKEYLAEKRNPTRFSADFLMMEEEDATTVEIMEENLEQLSNFSIDLDLKKDRFCRLMYLIYDSSILAFEFGPEDENGISDDRFKVNIENAFQNFLSEE